MTVREGGAHLTSNEERVCERPQRTVSNLVFDCIADYSAIDSVAVLRQKFVTVMPALERSFLLHVGKVVVPLEFGDAGNPLRT